MLGQAKSRLGKGWWKARRGRNVSSSCRRRPSRCLLLWLWSPGNSVVSGNGNLLIYNSCGISSKRKHIAQQNLFMVAEIGIQDNSSLVRHSRDFDRIKFVVFPVFGQAGITHTPSLKNKQKQIFNKVNFLPKPIDKNIIIEQLGQITVLNLNQGTVKTWFNLNLVTNQDEHYFIT